MAVAFFEAAAANCSAFLAFSAKYLTIRFTLHARALKYTASLTRFPPRTRKNPSPWARLSSEFVPSIPARSA